MSYYNRGRKNTTPCKYFQNGTCNKGSSCRFAHVYQNNNNTSNNNSTSRFEGNTNPGNNSKGRTDSEKLNDFINDSSQNEIQRVIANDMKEVQGFQVKPLMSSYSYEQPCMLNLINGRDYSAEESRFNYYQAQKNGTINTYETEINARTQDLQKAVLHVNAHPDWAARYLSKGTKELSQNGRTSFTSDFINFPLDLTGQSYGNTNTTSFGNNSFGNPTSSFGNNKPSTTFGSTSFAFGSAPNGFGSASNAFGSPSFGGMNNSNLSSNMNSNSAFGTPAFGGAKGTFGSFGGNQNASSSSSNAFGANPFSSVNNSSIANNCNSAFGTPSFNSSNPQSNSAFGKPAFGASPFGSLNNNNNNNYMNTAVNPSSTNNNSAFGNTSNSAFGAPSFNSNNSNNGFGSTQGTNTFGKLSSNLLGNTNGVGTTSSAGENAFGTPAFGSKTQTGSPFASILPGNPAQTTVSPFGQSMSGNNNGQMIPYSSPFRTVNQQSNVANNTSTGVQVGQNNQPMSNTSFGSNFQNSASNTQNTAQFGSQSSQNTNSTPFASTGFGIQPSPFSVDHGSNNATGNMVSPLNQGPPTEEERREPNDLLPETLEKFQATSFELGSVPDIPPPLALCF